MKTLEFFKGFIHPSSHKVEHNSAEFKKIKETPTVVMVKATTLYQIYKHNVFDVDGRLSIKDFYRIAGQYLYYDKYICKHGTEFYYHVVFNESNEMYQLTKDLISKRVYANRPASLNDLVYVVEAVSKEGYTV